MSVVRRHLIVGIARILCVFHQNALVSRDVQATDSSNQFGAAQINICENYFINILPIKKLKLTFCRRTWGPK